MAILKVWDGSAWVEIPVGESDHGAQSGLTDDDHTQYLLADGTRAMSGDLDMDGGSIDNVADLTLATGATVDEFSTDGTMAGDSDLAVPTEQAVRTYMEARGLDLSWSYTVGNNHMHDSGGGTFTHTSPSVWSSTKGVVGSMMNMGASSDEYVVAEFEVHPEVDLTEDITAALIWRVSGGPSAAHIARFEVELSATADNASWTAGSLKTTTVDHSIGSSGDNYSHGDKAVTDMGVVLTGGTLSASDSITGSYGRVGSHANDDYTGTVQMHKIVFYGKRKER